MCIPRRHPTGHFTRHVLASVGTRSRHSERGLASVSLVSQGEKLITSARHAAAVCDFERLGERVIPLGESPHASSNASPNSKPPGYTITREVAA
jgi:hypothetical protein